LSRRRRRIQDKWRMKDWYDVNSPSYFGGKLIASVPANSDDDMIGRIIGVTLYDITEDISQYHIKLNFQVVRLQDHVAQTIFKGHEYTGDYLRSLVRRGSTRVDSIVNVTTKDDFQLRVSVVAFSVLRVRQSQILNVRRIIREIVAEKAASLFFEQFVQEAVLGKIASDIYNDAKKIIPLRHVGIRKSKLITYPPEAITSENIEVSA
jgi:small subunit ribosomal protein S3Ae